MMMSKKYSEVRTDQELLAMFSKHVDSKKGLVLAENGMLQAFLTNMPLHLSHFLENLWRNMLTHITRLRNSKLHMGL
jgi:hypothetical protein